MAWHGMAILKEFRAMAGVRGREAHRPHPVPKYEYEKHGFAWTMMRPTRRRI